MASVYKKGKTWYLSYKSASGAWKSKASRARNKTEAREMAQELERRAERERLRLDLPVAKDGGGTVEELLRWWLQEYSCGSPSDTTNQSAIAKHLVCSSSELGGLRLVDLKSGHVEKFIQRKSREVSPQTVNHLRGYLNRAFNRAIETGRYAGINPVAKTKKRRVGKVAFDYLRYHEVLPVLSCIPARWRALFATAIYTGMRKGELLGLRKIDVDLDTGFIMVARSYARDTTKGERAEAVPIADEAVPFLRQAIDGSLSSLVFPGPRGKMRSRYSPLEEVLRRALAHAEVVEGYQHVCRKRGCEHAEAAADGGIRRCPIHNHKLWPKAVVRKIRFHDLRHTTASLLIMGGADLAAVQRILRHADPKTTTQLYGHLAPGYLRKAANRLSFHAGKDSSLSNLGMTTARSFTKPFSTYLLPAEPEGVSGGLAREENLCENNGLTWSGRRGSNSRPSAWEADALPTELHPHRDTVYRVESGRSSPITHAGWT